MQNTNTTNSKYSIGVIMTWFGKLPEYFPYWLKTAEKNESIDFICICDQEIKSDAANIKIYKTTLKDEVKKYENILGRKISIEAPYKFCDCRTFFGIFYADILKDYDFWGYCDIDLMFGDIRKFVTDEILDNHDRIYKNGHLCLYRNNEETNNLYKLTGAIYSLDEIFESPAKTTYEEFYGMNRICRINNIPWYTQKNFVDFRYFYPDRMEMTSDLKESKHQVFYWEDGHAYRAFADGNKVEVEEYAYLHFQKRKLIPDEMLKSESEVNSFYLCAHNLVKKEAHHIPTVDEMDKLNPVLSGAQKRLYNFKFTIHRWNLFCGYDKEQQKIKLREKRVAFADKLKRN